MVLDNDELIEVGQIELVAIERGVLRPIQENTPHWYPAAIK